jgi:hypothetical protein
LSEYKKEILLFINENEIYLDDIKDIGFLVYEKN